MRMRTAHHLAAFARFEGVLIGLPLLAIVAQLLLVTPIAQAGAVYPNPPNATPVAWPSSFTSYTTDTGTAISDVEGEAGVGSVYDISSNAGGATSVFLALSGNAAFFRVRVGSNPVDASKGGFTNATWLVLIGTEDSPGVWTTKAVTGVDGKPVGSVAAPDTVYVGNAPGTGITDVYQFNTAAPAYDPTNAVGTGARVVAASASQYWIDWQVPVSSLTAASGGVITPSTPVRLFFGSSAAANLATINKDYMTGGAVSFANLGTVTLQPPTLTLGESKALVSGPNPPQAGVTSVYDITVTAVNNGGSNLYTPSIAVTMPAGVTIVSQSTATGSVGAVGQVVTWTPGMMAGGAASISMTIRVSVTPGAPAVGTTLTLAGAAAGTGTDGTATITGTGTAQTAGPVADAPHTTTTGVSCPGGPIVYGDSISCTVTVSDTSGAATVPTGTVTMAGTLGSSTGCTLVAATATTATCTVTFTATGVGTGSLGATYGGDATHAGSSGTSGTIPIGKKALTVSVDPASRVYGAANPSFAVSYSGFVLGETSAVLGGSLAFSTAATAASTVGTYPVSASGLTSANYAFTYVPADLTVTQAPLTITADPASRPYGAPNPTFTASYAGFVNGDDPSDLTTPPVLATTATTSSPTGTYPITVSGATATNYAISFVSGTLTVGTATLTVTADPASRDYGAANPTFTAAITGFQGTDSIAELGGTLTCTSAATPASNVGSYPITCSGLTSANYAFIYVAGSLTVDPATLTVTPDPQSRAYGAANPTLTASLGGFVNGDTAAVVSGSPSCSTAATPASPAGTYAISCTAGTLSATNYVFDTTATGTLTVGQASLTIAVDPATKVYGDPNPAFTVTPTGLLNGDSLADLTGSLVFGTAADASSGVGSYPVTASGLSSPNYAISWTPGSLSVTKATLTVTPVNAVVPLGDPIPTSFATDITGFVNGDDPGDLTGAAACSTDAVTGDPAGEYTITCTVGTLTSPNYDFVIGGTAIFTIGPVVLHVTVDDATKSYGDVNPTFTVSYVGFVNGDTPAALGGSLLFSTAATTLSPAGTYPVTVSGLTSGSYTFDYQPGTLTVTPASQTITFGALAGVTYGDPTFDLTATASSGLPVTYTTTGPCSVSGVTVTISGAGTCTITAHQAGDTNHAAAPDVAQTLTIAKATPGLSWATPADIVVGTALSATQLNALATVAGSYGYSPASGAVLPVGTHTLSVIFTPTDSANYATVSTTVDIDVLAAPLLAQTIDFPALADVTSDADPITLGATASSGLAVTYTTTGPCTVVGDVLTITGTGTCTVTAHQDGNATYDAAPPVSVSFEVTAPSTPPASTPSSITTDREVVSAGGHVVVTATGFLPGSEVEVRILPDGDVITVTADQTGTIVVTLPIPADTQAGPLDIEALGVDPNGDVLDLKTTITILALPSTSTLESARTTPDPPIGSILLVVLGLLAIMVAAGAAAAEPGGRKGR
jgi:hypothetical protein